MTTKAEEIASKNLRIVLKQYSDGDIIQDSEEFREVIRALEFYILTMLQNKYRCWAFETIEDIYEQKSFKTKHNEIDLRGMCLRLSDWTLTPLHVRISINESSDKFDWVKCKVGEEGMLKIPFDSTEWNGYMVIKEVDEIDWVYEFEA